MWNINYMNMYNYSAIPPYGYLTIMTTLLWPKKKT